MTKIKINHKGHTHLFKFNASMGYVIEVGTGEVSFGDKDRVVTLSIKDIIYWLDGDDLHFGRYEHA